MYLFGRDLYEFQSFYVFEIVKGRPRNVVSIVLG